MLNRRHVLASALGCVSLPRMAEAQSGAAAAYPSRTVRFVVPFGAGGPADSISRTLAQSMAERWKQAVVVENKPGASGTIGGDIVAKAPPDGHTLLVINQLLVQAPALYKSVPYDPLRDLTPVTDLIASPLWLAVNAAQTPARSMREFVDQARSRGADLHYASVGTGSIGHLYGYRLAEATGLRFTHVPYKGAAPVVTALLAGEVTCAFVDYATLKPHLESGKLRALAVSDVRRTAATPDVPTFTEAGYKGFEAVSWIGLFAPARTPADVVQKIHAEATRILMQPDVVTRFQVGQGFQMGGQSQSAWTAQVAADHERWGVLIKAAGVTME